MPRAEPKLIDLYSAYAAKRARDGQPIFPSFHHEIVRCISRLAARDVKTNQELIQSLPSLTPKLREFGFWWLRVSPPPRAESIYLRMLRDYPSVVIECAYSLSIIEGRRTIREFVRIGKAQLSSPNPDAKWLDAVVLVLKMADGPEVVEMLVTIYERTDLPGWLRGDAGDALGCMAEFCDRRTRLFRRIWTTALHGLDDPDIEVQFWSMYVIMQLATNHSPRRSRSNHCFDPALPRLREIAENDHRLAPGYWWPMCEEAKDAIQFIETGRGFEVDASERWLGHEQRGETCKRY